MTIYRETCGYEPLTAARAEEFGVPVEDVGLWLIEYEYGVPPMPLTRIEDGERPQSLSVRVIPNTLARLARGAGILILP